MGGVRRDANTGYVQSRLTHTTPALSSFPPQIAAAFFCCCQEVSWLGMELWKGQELHALPDCAGHTVSGIGQW